MSLLDALVKRTPAPYRRLGRVIILLTMVLAVWTYFAELEEFAIAFGEVVPQGQVKVIQHLEGGIIKNIHVTEGTRVVVGDVLIQLDLIASGVSHEKLSLRLDSLTLIAARLEAEAYGGEPDFPKEAATRRSSLLANETRVFKARGAEFGGRVNVLSEQAHQRELAISGLRAEYTSVSGTLDVALEMLVMSDDLLTRGLTPKIENLGLRRDVKEQEGRLMMIESAIAHAESAYVETRERLKEERLKFRSTALNALGKTELAVAQTREALAKASDTLRRTEILSPIDGIVKSLRYHTVGGVVAPREAIMEIVPTSNNLVVEAKLNPTDVGYVRIGQPAVIKITTYDFVRYGGLDGKIINLSADSYTDHDGAIYFRVIAKTDKNYLGDQPGDFQISPGMEAQIDIYTGTKSVMKYLLKPVLKLKSEAFRER